MQTTVEGAAGTWVDLLYGRTPHIQILSHLTGKPGIFMFLRHFVEYHI